MGYGKRIFFQTAGWCCLLGLFLTGCKKAKVEGHAISNSEKHDRLQWNQATTVDIYKASRYRGSAWDDVANEALTEFSYTRSGILDSNEDWAGTIATDSKRAVEAGCPDPMVNYLYIRYAMDQSRSKEEFMDAFAKMAHNMDNSQYPPIRKFYAAARTMQQAFFVYGQDSGKQAITGEMWGMLNGNLQLVVTDKGVPAEEAYEACDLAFSLIWDENDLTNMYQLVMPPYFANWPDSYTAYLLKGSASVKLAWAARGSGYANTVSAGQWVVFKDDLNTARKSLETAWGMNPKEGHTALEMIGVCEGLSLPRDEMEKWFQRAMDLNPNYYDACHEKLHYLYPQWYGSRDDMVEFGRECVANTNWGGTVPLILSDAHYEYWKFLGHTEERTNYWKQPEVWPDIKASFDRLFALNPNATSYYHNYAWYAYKCEQWDKLNELIPKLGTVNYAYFGGKDEYDKMVELAKEHAAK